MGMSAIMSKQCPNKACCRNVPMPDPRFWVGSFWCGQCGTRIEVG